MSLVDQPSGHVEQVVALLENVSSACNGWTGSCPAHDDRNPSLSVAEGDDGRVLLHCFAGCEVEEIVAALGLTMSDLFPAENSGRHQGGGGPNPKVNSATPQHLGCTLSDYAEAKHLSIEFLRKLGLSDLSYMGSRAVRIPYRDESGSEISVRFRLAMTGNRFRWRKRSRPILYGLWKLADARSEGKVVLVEGESDCHTLWTHGIPACGLPGANSWKNDWSHFFEGIGMIFVVVEPDSGGSTFLSHLSRSPLTDRIRLVRLGEDKDPSELYMSDPEHFAERWDLAVRESVPWTTHVEELRAERRHDAWIQCKQLANRSRILDTFAAALADNGVVGEDRLAKLTYLSLTSRLFDRPVSLTVKGPSSAGKSYVTEQVLAYFPETAYHKLTAMSSKALAYSDTPLSHRFIVLFEATALQDEIHLRLCNGPRSVNSGQAKIVERIFREFTRGKGCSAIAGELNRGGITSFTGKRWHPLTVRRLLGNTAYTGRTIYRRTLIESVRDHRSGRKKKKTVLRPESEWIEVEGATPPIIDDTMFQQSQEILYHPDRRLRGRPSQHFRLRGRLRCMVCGTPMVGQAQGGGRYRYYRCRRAHAGDFEGICNSRYVPVGLLEGAVLEQIAEVLADPERILSEAAHLNPAAEPAELAETKKQLGERGRATKKTGHPLCFRQLPGGPPAIRRRGVEPPPGGAGG